MTTERPCKTETEDVLASFLSRAPAAPPTRIPRFNLDQHLATVPYHATTDHIAAVTCYFNPHGTRARRQCYADFSRQFPKIGLPLFTVEGTRDGWHETPAQYRYDMDPGACLFAKENLLNLAFARLPDRYDTILWLDCDLIPTAPDYRDRLTDSLGRHTVVQGFQYLAYLDRDGNAETGWRCGVAARNEELNASHGHPSKAYPGGAWAASRELLASVGGLYDRCVTGAGDVAWSTAVYGDADAVEMRTYWSPLLVDAVVDYCRRVSPLVSSVGYVSSRALHLYHGSRSNRNYTERHQVQVVCGYDPARHVEYAPNGTLRWAPSAPAMLRAAIPRYFRDRKEDD
jgi:hypothetical protein